MVLIVEVQGFCCSSFLPKEVFLLADDLSRKYLIKPGMDFSLLSDKEKKTIAWNSRYYHKIPWHMGNCTMTDFISSINMIAPGYKYIVTKGSTKAAYLSEILSRRVHDLSFYGCPSVRGATAACKLHFSSDARCAESSARVIKKFLDGHGDVEKLLGGSAGESEK